MRCLAVEGGALGRVLAVAQVVDLLEDQSQPAGEHVAGHVGEIRGDLGVVGGYEPVCLGRETLAKLGGDCAAAADLGHDLAVPRRVGDGGHSGVVAGCSGEQCRAADVDHLDGFVDRHEPRAHLRGKVADVDRDDIDQADLLGLQLGQLLGLVSPCQDAGVHHGMERLDLAAGDRLGAGQI